MDVKDEVRYGRLIVKNVDEMMEVFEVDLHASTYSTVQELKITQKEFGWSHEQTRYTGGTQIVTKEPFELN